MNPLDIQARRSAGFLLFLWALLVVLADWFFYRHHLGWTLGAYAFLLGAGILARDGRALGCGPGRLLTVAWLGLSAALVLDPSLLAVLYALGTLVLLRMIASAGWTERGEEWCRRWAVLATSGWGRIFRDSRLIGRRRGSRRRHGRRMSGLLARWFIPVVLSIVFLVLFRLANPIIDDWVRRGLQELGELIAKIDFPAPARVLFWILAGIWVWALLRLSFRHGKSRQTPVRLVIPAPPPVLTSVVSALPVPPVLPAVSAAAPEPSRAPDGSFIVRCLVLFNLLFMVQNLLDVRFLWGGAQLPVGMTYAEYSHHGAYPLIATALLAAVFVLAAFRPGANGPRMQTARKLVYFWLAQNVFLTLGAIFRLSLYIQAYSLTRWRLAAAIWMLLVAAGLALILWRIARSHGNVWLVKANLLVLLLVLYGCCFFDSDGFIARYNVRHCRETAGEGPNLDLGYLEKLGRTSLPALSWFAVKASDSPAAATALAVANRLRSQLENELADWRGWTWRREHLAQTWNQVQNGRP